MTILILKIAAACTPLLIWWLWRRLKRKDDPLQQHRDRYDEAQIEPKPVADTALADDLDELHRLQVQQGGKR